jgi:protein-S-isoprenylcysteine O-methyltransferase Ste14
MTEIDSLIQNITIFLGVIVLAAPLLTVLRHARRRKGLSSGRAAVARTWGGVLVMMVVFIFMGVILWKPIPLHFSGTGTILVTICGAAFYFPGIGSYLWGLTTLHSQFAVSGLLGADLYRDHELVTTGPFALLRHPMYFGVLLAAIGALLIFKTWAMLVFLPMSLVVLFRAEWEEKLLEREFGVTWKTYAAKVPKWIPRRSSPQPNDLHPHNDHLRIRCHPLRSGRSLDRFDRLHLPPLERMGLPA